MKKITLYLVMGIYLLLGFGMDAAAKSSGKEPLYYVYRVKIVGNRLLGSETLKDRVRITQGFSMSPSVMDLFAQEIEAFYASKGYHEVKVTLRSKPRNGVLTLKVDESQEMLWGRARAERAVRRLIVRLKMQVTPEKQEEVIQRLARGYRDKRSRDEEIKAAILARKQEELMIRVREAKAKKLARMRERIMAAKTQTTEPSPPEKPRGTVEPAPENAPEVPESPGTQVLTEPSPPVEEAPTAS